MRLPWLLVKRVLQNVHARVVVAKAALRVFFLTPRRFWLPWSWQPHMQCGVLLFHTRHDGIPGFLRRGTWGLATRRLVTVDLSPHAHVPCDLARAAAYAAGSPLCRAIPQAAANHVVLYMCSCCDGVRNALNVPEFWPWLRGIAHAHTQLYVPLHRSFLDEAVEAGTIDRFAAAFRQALWQPLHRVPDVGAAMLAVLHAASFRANLPSCVAQWACPVPGKDTRIREDIHPEAVVFAALAVVMEEQGWCLAAIREDRCATTNACPQECFSPLSWLVPWAEDEIAVLYRRVAPQPAAAVAVFTRSDSTSRRLQQHAMSDARR